MEDLETLDLRRWRPRGLGAAARCARAAAAAVAAASLVLLVSCNGGGGASEQAAPPPETTEYSATTFSRLSFAVRSGGGTGTGAGAPSFGLLSAPEGVVIDPSSGQIEWTPRPDQIGDHDLSVAVMAADGVVANKSYRITVLAPADETAYLVLRTDGTAYTPGQAIVAQWHLGGEWPQGAAVEIGVQAPEADPAAAEGSPTAWTLNAQGAWSATPVRLQDAARAGQATLVLPNRVAGHWLITARLLDADGTPLAAMATRVLVAAVPTLRLTLNRTLAQPLDDVRVALDLAQGATPLAARLMAWMVRPDGSKLGLASLDAAEFEVNRNDTASGWHLLLQRAFTADEAGDYRILVRLYASADGRLLQEAGARFSVCSATSTLAGTVLKPDRGPLDGPGMAQAVVLALNVDAGGVTEATAIASDGGYTLDLPPGRYVVTARALGTAGATLEADPAPVLVGCTAAVLARDFQLRTR